MQYNIWNVSFSIAFCISLSSCTLIYCVSVLSNSILCTSMVIKLDVTSQFGFSYRNTHTGQPHTNPMFGALFNPRSLVPNGFSNHYILVDIRNGIYDYTCKIRINLPTVIEAVKRRTPLGYEIVIRVLVFQNSQIPEFLNNVRCSHHILSPLYN